MIEKMKYINIITKIDNLDEVIEKYILKYDIQLEEASKKYKSFDNFITTNKYAEYYKKIKNIVSSTNLNTNIFRNISEKEALETLNKIYDLMEQKNKKIKLLEKRITNLENTMKKIEYFTKLDFNIEDISKFNFIKFKFGKIPIDNFKQFKLYLYKNTNIIFIESTRDEKNIYCICFYTENLDNNKIQSLLDSLNFEFIDIPFEVNNIILTGSPIEIYKKIKKIIEEQRIEIDNIYKKSFLEHKISKEDIISTYNKIKNLYFLSDAKKYLAKISDEFYIFLGWIPEKELKKLENEIINDDKVIIKIEDYNELCSKPPTKLKNKFFFRPFEFFVKTYGIPQYNELDPTPFLAITYTIIFGMMFGDLGQGLIISILGFILYKYKKIESSLIMMIVGFSSMVFGILYGSVFGFEDIIPTLWMKPSENINKTLFVAIFLGVILTIISMILNIINALKEKNKIRLYLSSNGILGIIFYIGSIVTIITFLNKKFVLSKILLITFVIIPIIGIAFKGYISKKFKYNKEIIKENKIMTIIETFIEIFEILLTYFTNTLSFVRVGAFALSHAGMMGVILLLAKNENGSYNPFIIILGNILVIVVESVIVSIQVLRIQFYEMFSRYYTGGGKKFEPYNKKINNGKINI